jgi:hypothetical protein
MGIISLAKSRLISKAAPYLLVLIAALVSIFLLTRSDPRFHLIALGWFGVCVLNAGVCKGSAAKLLWINGGFFFFLFGTAEFYLRVSQTPSRPPTSQEGTKSSLMRPDDLLGYAPKANMTVSDRMLRGGELIWDVIYTIDEHGLRVTPRPINPTECVLFFGGSFAFGSGLNDEETMAKASSCSTIAARISFHSREAPCPPRVQAVWKRWP